VNIMSAALRLVHLRSVVVWIGAAMMTGGVVEPADRRPRDGTRARREPCA
jgi:putative copper export protein